MEYISLNERPEKLFVRIMMVIFGLMCLFTAGWWALFLYKNPDNENIFWIATLFLLFFGLYQVYAGLGYATRYIKIEANQLVIRQNAFLKARTFNPGNLESVVIRGGDILFLLKGGERFRLKIGIRYPGTGEKIRNHIITFAEANGIITREENS